MTITDIPERYRVSSTRRETEDTWTLELEPVATREVGFAPGQFTMLYAFGAGEVPISVSGDPGRHGTLVHTVRAVGATTRAVCAAAEGQELGVRGPFGRGWPVADAEGQDLVVVAGGVGLAPLRSVLYTALADRERYGRLVLLYGGRTPDQLLFRDELVEWSGRDDIEVSLIVDAADEDWHGRVGVVPALVERAGLAGGAVAMVCGPEVMMRYAVEALLDAGLAPDRVHLSMERNMKCAVGHCGHCQWGPSFVCRDGPVYSWSEAERWFGIREL
ncbi:MAG TPA: FAD/NAD(P)-binding protein [Solirubrobacterales bacterium]|jgi:NAD(P)H-flavin reductase